MSACRVWFQNAGTKIIRPMVLANVSRIVSLSDGSKQFVDLEDLNLLSHLPCRQLKGLYFIDGFLYEN